MTTASSCSIAVSDDTEVSSLLDPAERPKAGYVLAHGAGAGMTHPLLQQIATGLAARAISTLRYQFPYMERGSKRPDVPKLAHATVRAAVAEAARCWPGLPLLAGGKSFGARMTSQAQAASPLPGVVGLVFLGFPLHPAGKPGIDRAQHLAAVKVPMLFVQGTRDELADVSLIESTVGALGALATLHWVPDGDHSFRVPARTGRKPDQVMAGILDTIRDWAERIDATR
jgi:predicted alpha/beta-hydrolase family hydrolase